MSDPQGELAWLSMVEPGPFRVDQLHEGERYELSQGHAIYCLPTGGRGARANLVGAAVLATDPAVQEAGFDPGYTPDAQTLRAPDIGVGHVPDEPGWVAGAPPLAVEYADVGQDEAEFQLKIRQLLAAGTRYLWVVRLIGPRRVEVYTPDQPRRIVDGLGELTAPGVLQNPVPVAALYDQEIAHEQVLQNLLQRRGYGSLEAAAEEGRSQGLEEGRSQGLAEGRSQGLAEGQAQLIRQMAERGHGIGEIAELTGLTPTRIEELLGQGGRSC